MERRNWSLEALNELIRADSLDSFERADALVRWYNDYLGERSIEDFDLELEDLKKLEELFFKSIKFLREHKEVTREELKKTQQLKKFFNH